MNHDTDLIAESESKPAAVIQKPDFVKIDLTVVYPRWIPDPKVNSLRTDEAQSFLFSKNDSHEL